MSKILSWFSTKNGKIFTRTCVGVFAFSTFGASYLIHGPYQHKLRELSHFYRNGRPKPLSETVDPLTKNVIKDSSLSEEEKKKLQFFNVVGLDLTHIGGLNSPWGASIGVPFYFDDMNNIDFGDLRIHGQDTLDWIVEAPDLMTALNLSEKAKKFALMREIYSCDIWDVLDNALILPFCIVFSAEFARRVNQKKDAFNKSSFKARCIFYFFCFSIGIIMYRLLKDPLKHISDKKSDELAALTGKDYLEGGIEFYEHLLMRNKVLRKVLGTAGEKKFDENGNENYYILFPKLPTSKRLELLKKLQMKKDNSRES